MWKNYLKSGVRSLLRTRAFSLINVLGLTVGMACVLLVAVYVQHELTYDRMWENGSRIARVLYRTQNDAGEAQFLNEIPDNVSDIALPMLPGIEASSRFVRRDVQAFPDDRVIRGQVTFVEPQFFNMIQPAVAYGNASDLFPGKENIVLTQSAAKKYFGESDPVGQILVLNLFEEKRAMMVTGVIEDFPENSIFNEEILAPYKIYLNEYWYQEGDRLWQTVSSNLYLMVEESSTFAQVEERIRALELTFDGETPWGAKMERYRLQLLHQVHVALSNPAEYPTDSSAFALRLLMLIGVIILLLACVNFTTLSIGQASTRLREVGVRKVLGAQRADLIRQFWVETSILALVALLLAVPLVELILPGFQSLAGAKVELNMDGSLLLFLCGIWLTTVFIAGVYPSLALSGFRIIAAIKGEQRVGGKGSLRRVLVFVQLTVAVGLLTATLVMLQQMNFVQKRDLGFHGEQVVILDASTDNSLDNAAERLRNELSGDPGILGISQVDCSFQGQWSQIGWSNVEVVKDKYIYNNNVDPQFKDVMQLEMAAGRWFRVGDKADEHGAVILNETMADLLGGKQIVGQTYPDLFNDATIIGVVKDFHFHDLTRTIEPLVLMQTWDVFSDFNSLWFEHERGYVYVRLSPDNIPGAMKRLEYAWQKVVPEAAFEFSFLQEEVDAQYRDMARWNRIMTISTGLAILISLLGLIGISAMQVARRTREIGIRKVLGASIVQLLSLLSREVLLLVVLANVIAWPVAYVVMKRWLENFAYRIDLGWGLFLLAGVFVLLVSLGTVSVLSMRVANINPVNTLRSE